MTAILEREVEPAALDLVATYARRSPTRPSSTAAGRAARGLQRCLTGARRPARRAAGPAAVLRSSARLGFKRAVLPPAREVPAISHFYGLDRPTGRLVHVHAHFRLVLGDDTTRNFWLPSRAPTWTLARETSCCPSPAAEHELTVLVLRMVLGRSTSDAQLQRRGDLTASEERGLAWLLRPDGWERAGAVVAAHLPFLVDLWPACRRAVEPGSSRMRARAADRRRTRPSPGGVYAQAAPPGHRPARGSAAHERAARPARPASDRQAAPGRRRGRRNVGGDGAGKARPSRPSPTGCPVPSSSSAVHLGDPPTPWRAWRSAAPWLSAIERGCSPSSPAHGSPCRPSRPRRPGSCRTSAQRRTVAWPTYAPERASAGGNW